MITAIDTNILLDIFLPDPEFGDCSLSALERAYGRGALVICTVVYAELVPQFENRKLLDATLEKLDIEVLSITREAAYIAGQYWKKYSMEKKGRTRIITNFLIGAFAEVQADRMLTRDRGFYRTYLNNLQLFE